MDLEYLEISLTEHCNLNCKGCSHFSPIAEPSFIQIDTFKRDIMQISRLFDKKIKCFRLMGGEPLLHPCVGNILGLARLACPDSNILLVTNGIKLGSMTDSFWQSCVNNRITIHVTKYPIPFDYEKAILAAQRRGATVTVSSNSLLKEKTFHHLVLDRAGKQDRILNFNQLCTCSSCTNLSDGKLYPCPIVASVHHFNRFFDFDFPVTEKDYVDIYQNKISAQSILAFLQQPIPFCEYCNCSAITHGHKWEYSERTISEWT